MKNFFLRGGIFKFSSKKNHPSNYSRLSIIFLIIASSFLYISFPDESFGAIKESKLYLDLLFITLQMLMFYLFEKKITYSKHNIYLKLGILFWITGVTIGIADEIVPQQQWVILSLGRPLKITGLLILLFSCYKQIQHLEKLYFGANIDALHDDLTKLPNRRHFNITLEKSKNIPLGLILIDIDHFKKINDKHGHNTGDKILKQFGDILQNISSERYIASRIGGEEFAVIIKTTTPNEIFNLAKTISKDAKKIIIDDNSSLSISIGLGLIKKNESTSSLMKRTDEALYKSKNTGRGRIAWSEII